MGGEGGGRSGAVGRGGGGGQGGGWEGAGGGDGGRAGGRGRGEQCRLGGRRPDGVAWRGGAERGGHLVATIGGGGVTGGVGGGWACGCKGTPWVDWRLGGVARTILGFASRCRATCRFCSADSPRCGVILRGRCAPLSLGGFLLPHPAPHLHGFFPMPPLASADLPSPSIRRPFKPTA